MRLVGRENKQEEKSRVKRRKKKLRGRGENKRHAWGKKPGI